MIQDSLLRWLVDKVLGMEALWLNYRVHPEMPADIVALGDQLLARLKHWRHHV